METLYQILAIAAAGLIMWFLYRQIKASPQMFSKENLSKSFTTLGILGVILIVFVTMLVWLAKGVLVCCVTESWIQSPRHLGTVVGDKKR